MKNIFVICCACSPGPKISEKINIIQFIGNTMKIMKAVKYIHSYTDHITTQYSALAFLRTASPFYPSGSYKP